MKDVIVVLHATHRAHLMDEYEAQLRYAEIDCHVEPVDLPDGIGSMTMRWRLDYWKRMSEKFSEWDRIIFTDAWDVLYFGPREQLLWIIPPVLMSAERNCWPDESLAHEGPSPWRYPNPGMLAGYPEAIIDWTNRFAMFPDVELMDQLWSNRFHSYIPLDTRTMLFYVASADKEDGSLQKVLGAPCNMRYHTFPQFIHFAGPCHPSRFRALMRDEVPAL